MASESARTRGAASAGGTVSLAQVPRASREKIKAAGTASLLISIPKVLVGILRHLFLGIRASDMRSSRKLSIAPVA